MIDLCKNYRTGTLLTVLIAGPWLVNATGSLAEGSGSSTNDGVIIEGALDRQGAECPLFRITNGEVVSLSGQLPSLEIDQHIRLRGKWQRISNCMQGRTFHVSGISEVE